MMTPISLPQAELDREQQCPHRKRQQCALLNHQLGMALGLGLDMCNLCYNMGWGTRDAAHLRFEWVARVEHAREHHEAFRKATDRDRKHWKGRHRYLILQYIKTKVSRGFGLFVAAPQDLLDRHTSCHGDATTKPCVSRVNVNGTYHCGTCGCGYGPETVLTVNGKLAYPHLSCPRNRKGFSNGRPLWKSILRAITRGHLGK